MIPYLSWTSIAIGPFTLHVWGLFVALGFLLGSFVAARMVRFRGGDTKHVYDLTVLFVLGAAVGGRLGHVLFYEPAYFLANPIEILFIWQGGMSLFGGLIACLVIALWYFRKHQLDPWMYSDSLIFGLPFGLWIGRIGCFLIHDHPGTATDFVLGVEYPDGIVRHDHGLYLSLNGLAMSLVFLFLAKKRAPVGSYIAIFSIWYGAVRFFLDFYRAADVKYWGLTPAQYMCIVLVLFGVVYGINFLRKNYARK